MTISILLVDDDVAVKSATQEFLELSGIDVTPASSAEEALELLNTFTPDIVLTDIMMQGMDGLELTRFVRKNYGVAVLVMTGYSANYSYEEAVNAGASDFIFKPFRFEELDLRIKRVLREVRLKREHAKMVDKLEELAITDGLTGLYNSRHFFCQLKAEIERYTRYHHPLSVLLLDIDLFKNYNDTWGHLEGDKVLMTMGEIITSCLRSNDTAYRYGGEEFTVVLPETRVEEACLVGERIRGILSQRVFTPEKEKTAKVTISIGATQFSTSDTLESFIKRADKAMYDSKKAGRDQLTCLPAPETKT
ncbi:signal transduction family protein (GGDEF domain protein) [Desulforapulum autotrophicum HRM2]|uniref:diguanylate cyclase n=1 Tax=Desulforapulum autotrophicum (strain ATCC 43914 / DSM 3382 / VKM B-1955 / HRM2) TaxID=177437 RepID=C0QDC5_DESAH|nr:diguanylate cyclase [Desulforapulum autotrophicum]ACN15189.1 signal transduction family protein (GGDEF domain protein) [Desulforapulum autotrophicum HRM2]